MVPSNRHADETKSALGQTKHTHEESSPEAIFRLLPAAGRQGDPKYVAQDAFGYSFLSDVFMADYKKDAETWQGSCDPTAMLMKPKEF